nr:YnbE family lipoprotein [Microbulbifer aggregans]
MKLPAITATLVISTALLSACTPTVAVQAPSEPITVNLNVKIEHEIRVKVDKELDDLFDNKEGIF